MIEKLIDKFTEAGGILGLIIFVLFGFLFNSQRQAYLTNRELYKALRKSSEDDDHELREVRKAMFKHNLLNSRRDHSEDVANDRRDVS